MLDTMRRGANTFAAKLLLGLLTLSFIGWGVGSRLGASHSDTIAAVGGTKVSLGEFQRAYQRQSQDFARRLGQPLTPDLARAVGLPQQVLASLMARATVDDIAASLGLGISDARLAQEIADDPTLRPPGASGFDHTYFLRLLQQNGLSESMYVGERRGQALERQLTDGLTGALVAPKALVDAAYRYQNESRHVEYATLARAQVEPIAAPTDEALAKWFADNKAKFKAPELRTIRFLKVTPETAADPSTVSDADARREYERTRTQYAQPERRRVEQLLYPTLDEARAAADKLKAGARFDDLLAARALKAEDVDLGLVTRDKILDPAVAEAAFKLPADGVSEPVKSTFGAVILHVTEIRPETVRPFEEVAADIKTALAARTAERTILDTHDEVEDALAGGATLGEVASRFKLKLATIVTDMTGKDADGEPIADIPDEAKLLAAAFATEEGAQNDPLQADHGFVWFDVAKIAPGRERTLDEVRDKAIAAWTDEEAQRRLEVKATAMVAALKSGSKLAALAADADVELEEADVTRQSDDAGLGAAGIAAAFDGPEGHSEAVAGPDDTRLVLCVVKIDNPAVPEGAGDALVIADRLAGQMQASLFGQYLEAAQERFGTTINQSLLNAVVGASAN